MTKSRIVRVVHFARARLRWAFYNAIDALKRSPRALKCRICEYEGPIGRFRPLRARCVFGGGTLLRYECPDCGVIFGTLRMLSLGAAALAREYRDVYLIHDEGPTTPLELEAFRNLNPEKDRVYLNYGAGRWSAAVAQLRNEGYDVLGFDRYVKGGAGNLIDAEDLARRRFDGIFTNSVLEHLSDPVEEMRFLRSLLKDDRSCVVHSTPCFRYEIEYSRFHLYFFAGRSAEVLAERSGFTMEHTHNPDVKRFVPKRD